MAGIVRVGATPNYNDTTQRQRLGNDSLYGPGTDGTVVIASNVTLSRDMYYDNLTVNSGSTLNTNGFRVFVKNTLTVSGTINNTGSTNTVRGVSSVGSGNVDYSIGGNSGGNTFTATSLTDGQKKDLLSLINGTVVLSDGSIKSITGGAAGANGAAGTVTPAGSAGTGSLNRNPLSPGGPGTAGTTPPAASGGSGGSGGGIILVAAKQILGSGTISATGGNATSGGNSATGTAGTSAPSQTLTHLTDGSADYRTGDGTGPHASVTAPNVPHGGHVGATSAALYGHTYRHVHRGNDHGRYHDHYQFAYGPAGHYTHGDNGVSHSGGNYGHTWNTHGPYSPDNGTYYHINGIPHSYPHRPHTGVAYTADNAHHGNGDVVHAGGTHGAHFGSYSDNPVGSHFYHPAYHNKISDPAEHGGHHYPRNHQDINYTHVRNRSAGTVSSQGSNVYPGGAGGAAGSTTAGANGVTGGGGGIILISDSVSNTLTTSVTGGTGGTGNASSGSVITILNT